MVVDENTVLKLMIMDKLKTTNNVLLKELSWALGVSVDRIESAVKDLGRNYLIELRGNRVLWNIADNPSMLKPWGWKLIHEVILGSTMEYAKGCGLWSVVVAEYQLLGRGRHGKKWIGGFGGLWTTFRLPIMHENANYLPLVIPLIIVDILDRNYGVKTMIKWPNDIIYGDKKIIGILIEAEAMRDRLIANIGLGINVNNDPPLPGSISLKKILGRKIPRNGLLSLLIGWISRVEKLLDDPRELKERYMERLATLNKKVRIMTRKGVLEGVAVDVNELGELVVEVNGRKKAIGPDLALEVRHAD